MALIGPVFEIIGSVIEITKLCCIPIGQHINYTKDLRENVQTLRSKMEELAINASDIKREVDRAKLLGKIPKHEIEYWLRNVEEVAKEVNEVEQDVENYNNCFTGCSSNFNSRRKFGKRVHKLNQMVDKIKDKNFDMDYIAVDPLPPTGLIFPTTTLKGESTAEKTLERIWDCVMDVKIGRIGVYGMGGVGKTTILKHVNNRVKESDLFDCILWVTVSKDSSVRSLQNKILSVLKLSLSKEEDDEVVSAKIFEAFKHHKKYILMLDDMWHAFPLDKIGIPEPNEANGCKVILTTRSLAVCREMETQVDIKVNVLSREEAWGLFMEKAGDVVLVSQIKPIAELVCEECAGLPLAIITVGRALRQVNDVSVWRNGLNDLKGLTNNINGIELEIFQHLKFSFNCLRNDTIQACFLYCALFHEDYVIRNHIIIDLWIWEGLINEMGNREVAMDKGQAILSELKDLCLLETESYLVQYGFKMHDLVRDMAISITKVKPRFIVKTGLEIDCIYREEEWEKDIERISLMMANLKDLPNEPLCPNLSTLFLQENRLLLKIPPFFFKYMNGLKVIDLSRTKIESLPESLSDLENLSALVLTSCKRLKKVPSLAKLKKLMALYLRQTFIDEFPEGLEFLEKLQILDLVGTKNLRKFPSEVIVKLSLLETFKMYHSGWSWSTDINDLIESKALVHLHTSFLNSDRFNGYVTSGHWRRLKSFYFMVGLVKDQQFYIVSKVVEINGRCENGVLELPDSTEALSIQQCNNVADFTDLINFSNLRDLKEFCITKCYGVESIIAEEITLPRLEILKLVSLPDLRVICKGLGSHVTVESLKILDIRWCDNLRSLFSVSLFNQLQNLEILSVWRCETMKEMIVQETEIDKIKLPRLETFLLHDMPELESICVGEISCSSLTTIRVLNCPKLKKLPLSIDDLQPALLKIEGSREWWDALEWDDPNAKTLLQPSLEE